MGEPALANNDYDEQDLRSIYLINEDTKLFSIKARFNNGYTWSKLLNSIKKYGQLIYEAY
jgi:hypothetical protein